MKKNKNYIYRTLLFMTLLVFMGCGAYVHTSKYTNKDLNTYSTYAFLPVNDTISNPAYEDRLVKQLLLQEISAGMEANGYTLEQRKPDLLVKTHIMLDQETDVVSEPVYSSYYYTPAPTVNPVFRPYYYRNYSTVNNVVGYNVREVNYTEGKIVIDLIDRRTNNIVWRGLAEDYVEAEDLSREVSEYVQEIFEEFPEG